MTIKERNENKTYIDLISLKAANLLQKQDFNMILKEDIWNKKTLLAKSGHYLTENIIIKLMNFGVENISVDFSEEIEDTSGATLFRAFLKTRNVLIIDDEMSNIFNLTGNLLEQGFEKSNILITDNYNLINKIFKDRQINLIFINSALYGNCARCVDKYSLLKHTHAFVVLKEYESARKLRGSCKSEVKFLTRPISALEFKLIINSSLSRNFIDFYSMGSYVS